jgi:hypothetical protein
MDFAAIGSGRPGRYALFRFVSTEEKKMSVRRIVLVLAASAAALVGSTAGANPQASQAEERARERAVQPEECAQQPGELTATPSEDERKACCEPTKLTTEQKRDREDWERLQQLRQRVP